MLKPPSKTHNSLFEKFKIMRRKKFTCEVDGRQYELTIDDQKYHEEIVKTLEEDDLTSEECMLTIGVLFYEIDKTYGHAFLLSIFGDDEVILEKMWKCPVNPENLNRFVVYMNDFKDYE